MGLRREELAELAGLSVDYVVRLEQGRATSPSAQVVASLARALQLQPLERDHAYRLADLLPPQEGNGLHARPGRGPADAGPSRGVPRGRVSVPTGPCCPGPPHGRCRWATPAHGPTTSGIWCGRSSPRGARGSRPGPCSTTATP
ncbi:helix-turn-helix domain-containing protein [Streptomyces sp. NPDC057740]|uniref:helix-turn-helix domain-containing protein n=1 Tax=Streptomyces sp. NPDC057740 TaxID=3346234 RepID=UPI0036A2C041